MPSDYDLSDDENEYYDDEDDDMFDGTQEEGTDNSDDDEMMSMSIDALDDFKSAGRGSKNPYEVESKSLSTGAVATMMQEDIDHICGILGVEANIAMLLLRHLRWNKEKLIEKYMDNPTKVSVEAGLVLGEPTVRRQSTQSSQSTPTSKRTTRAGSRILSSLVKPSLSSSTSSSSRVQLSSPISPGTTGQPFTCPICYDDDASLVPLSSHPACGQSHGDEGPTEHAFCSGCWTAYLQSKINDEAEHRVQCMAEGCTLVVTDDYIHALLVPSQDTEIGPKLTERENKANAATWTRFEELLKRDFVAAIPSLKYCPYPGCTNTVSCPAAASKSSLTSVVPTVSCGARGIIADTTAASSSSTKPSSGQSSQSSMSSLTLAGKEHKFCFGCPIESDHRPVVCGVAKMWLQKCRDDSETANWIKSNTKECSKCQSTIEKNGGCNHMTCKKCKYEFCWVCMGPWSEHGTQWYSCNRYDEKGGVDARDSQSKSRASLERYLHYYNRWANHEQSAKLALDLFSKTEKKMEDMQITSSLTWIEVQFMKKAVEEVDKCRMTLKWTYAMAYYLAKSNQKDLFEDNQRDLERAVEDLSELLESPIEPENIPALRQKVTDKTVYVQKRNGIVLEDTARGFLEGRWKWNINVEGFDDVELEAV